MPAHAPVTGIRLSLWRALTAFRVAGLLVCCYLVLRWQPLYARPGVALAVAGAMIAVTGVLAVLALTGRAHRPAVVLPDVAVTVGLTLATVWAQTPAQRHGGMVTLTTIWAAGPVIESALLAGVLGGSVAGVVQLGVAMLVRAGYDGDTLYSGVLLVVTGAVVGLVATYTDRAERDLRAAAAAQAAVAERERLARAVHDGVLQVLGLVHRTGRDAGRPWGELATAAAEQEAALRGLITSRPDPRAPRPDAAELDLGAVLRGLRSARVTVSTPAQPVTVPADVGMEVADAVRAALHNVERHAGPDARAWVLLEDAGAQVGVTVRDDGAGFGPERLAQAAAQGRLGVRASVRGRIEALGGTCAVVSAPGQGTEIAMQVPRR